MAAVPKTILISGDCAGRKLDIAILGDKSRSVLKSHQALRNLRLAVQDIVDKLGVSPDGTNFGMN